MRELLSLSGYLARITASKNSVTQTLRDKLVSSSLMDKLSSCPHHALVEPLKLRAQGIHHPVRKAAMTFPVYQIIRWKLSKIAVRRQYWWSHNVRDSWILWTMEMKDQLIEWIINIFMWPLSLSFENGYGQQHDATFMTKWQGGTTFWSKEGSNLGAMTVKKKALTCKKYKCILYFQQRVWK